MYIFENKLGIGDDASSFQQRVDSIYEFVIGVSDSVFAIICCQLHCHVIQISVVLKGGKDIDVRTLYFTKQKSNEMCCLKLESPPCLCFSTCQGESLTKQWTWSGIIAKVLPFPHIRRLLALF